MGEVYRARDARLGREVALKLLSGEAESVDRRKLHRFEQEARVVSSLSHPNIVTVYEIGEANGISYIAMELVEGQTLRQLVPSGGMPTRKLLDLSTQVAEGLARAHEAGIVHRDLKPDNVMVTPSGIVKILDFGLAKLTWAFLERGAEADEATLPLPTQPGVLLGTVRYMSPEQAAGAAADYRSDQFSFGSVVYELATSEPAFHKPTTVDTLSAILHDEPPPIAQRNPRVPAPLRWIIERCLAKDPKSRYASTEDLARDLAALRAHLSEVSGAGESSSPFTRRPARRWLRIAAAAGLAACFLAAGIAIGRRGARTGPPVFRQLTFQSGVVRSASFTPDGTTILYGANWKGRPAGLYVQRIGSPESRPLGVRAGLFGVSPSGEIALALDWRPFQPWIEVGTLARMEMASDAAPREVMNDVEWASWSPDGRDFAIVREVGGRSTLEYPIGTVLHQATGGFLSHPAVSRDGSFVAFLDHPVRADDAGGVAVVDRQGRSRTLVDGLLTVYGLGWSPRGDEVWFTGTSVGSNRSLQAVNLAGRRRVLARVFGSMQLDDVSPSGRVLVTHDQRKQHMFGLGPGEVSEHELSWLDYSLSRAISRDGKRVLFVEGGEGAGSTYGVFLRGTDGAAAIRLGDGDAQALSRDGKWALAILRDAAGGPRLAIYSTGAGPSRTLPASGLDIQRADFTADGTGLLITAGRAGEGSRLYLQDLAGGAPRPISPEGFGAVSDSVSPDGSEALVNGPNGDQMRFPLGQGSPVRVPVPAGGFVCGWTSDGAHVFVGLPAEASGEAGRPPGPRRVAVLDLKTGELAPWKTLGGEDGATAIRIAPDGRAYVYSFVHTQGDLYVIEGLN